MTFLKKIAAAALVGAASIGLSGCATGLPAKVTRFQAMPAPQGQSFYVVPGTGLAQGGGLEWSRYAALVAQQMAARVQLEQMRGRVALPPGTAPQPPTGPGGGTGQYL